jgi:diguanylate cyclase (GGDEF)-like protein
MDENQHPPSKNQSPETAWLSIDRQDWQLWTLSFLLIFVLGVGLLSFMFPSAFLERNGILKAPERPFYGFSLLLILTLAYLCQKQTKLRELKRKQWEEKLVQIAFHDPLTNLPNRLLFLDRLGLCVSRAERSKDFSFAVLYMDLDRFKIINDSMGHVLGDQLLVQVGRRLQSSLRSTDTVSRLGGDEFAILMEDIKRISDVARTVERVRNQFLLPLNLDGHEMFTSASIGIALSSHGYHHAEDLLRDADTAMYRAKVQGGDRHEMFDSSMHEQAVKQLTLENDLRRAVERQELRLHYQPIMPLRTGLRTAFEALVRWQHPDYGLLAPAEFIPAAEQSQLIIPITQWVLQEACSQARIWRSQLPADSPFSISVNLATKYFAKKNMVEEISDLIANNGLPPEYLRLEITESGIMGNPNSVSKVLLNLSKIGVKIYIDDFGTGYSSLNYLAKRIASVPDGFGIATRRCG